MSRQVYHALLYGAVFPHITQTYLKAVVKISYKQNSTISKFNILKNHETKNNYRKMEAKTYFPTNYNLHVSVYFYVYYLFYYSLQTPQSSRDESRPSIIYKMATNYELYLKIKANMSNSEITAWLMENDDVNISLKPSESSYRYCIKNVQKQTVD